MAEENQQKNAKKKGKPRGRPFEPGHAPTPGGGRPLGSKNFTNLNIWLGQIWEDLQEMPPAQRVQECKWAVTSILTKVGSLPATPGDSVDNARRLLGAIEPAPIALPGAQDGDSTGVNAQNGSGSTH